MLGISDPAELRRRVPALVARDEAFADALIRPIPVLQLRAGLSSEQLTAQQIALATPSFLQYSRDGHTGDALRSEIFGIYPARDSDYTPQTESCRSSRCFRVEMYNYALNLTSIALVDVVQNVPVGISQQPNTQPDIPPALTELAAQIAAAAPEVEAALGKRPTPGQAVMANTKTSLRTSTCERSKHLCVAPTFVEGNRALWAIVDLTEGSLVGARWTDLGVFDGLRITEKQLQNDVVTRQYCEHETALQRDGWAMQYILTSSDGLRISDVTYNGRAILRNAKLVDWHVNYSQLEGFGYSDAVGCPVFSQAAVIAIGPPSIRELLENGQPAGFSLSQGYWSEFWPQPCNYNYEQIYEFYTDGRFRVKTASLGRGCGNDGTYRPVFRIALAEASTFAQWSGSAWKPWEQEQWALEKAAPATTEGAVFRFTTQTGGFLIEPGRGQFPDGGRGDNAYVYVTHYDPARDEGESDMITIGPCCNADERQGPEKFIDAEPESITDSQIVLWYVPQLKNDDTPGSEYCWANSILQNGIYETKAYPCFAGPMFIPIE